YERRDADLTATTSPAASRDELVFGADGAHVDSCEEVAFEEYQSFSVLRDRAKLQGETARKVYDLAYSGSAAIVSATDHPIGTDSPSRPLPPIPWDCRPKTALYYWDATGAEPASAVTCTQESFAWHRQRAQEAAANSWPDEELELLQAKQAQ